MNLTPASPAQVPVMLVDTIAYCDSGREHEIRVITDGRNAYAFSTDPRGTDAGQGCRFGSTITFDCNQPGRDDEPCDGQVRIDVTDPVWVTATAAARDLLLFGMEVES